MTFMPLVEREISAIRVVLNWRSQPRLEFCRNLYAVRITGENSSDMELRGESEWRRAKKRHAIEIAQFVKEKFSS